MQQPLLDLISAKRSFLLSGHEHPDGDCVGSQAALYHLLVALDKRVAILNPDPPSRNHQFLLRHTPFESHREGARVPDAEVVVLLDCAHLSRLGALGPRIRESGAVIATIDHHVDSLEGEGTVCYVDSDAPSTGSLVYELFKSLSVPIGVPAAEGVFLSLVSDTGWFRYSNTDSRVLAIAAELVEAGLDPGSFYDRVFRRNHPDSVAFLAAALAGHAYSLGGRYAYAWLDREAADRAGRLGFDTDTVLEVLRSVEGVEVVALFKERQDGTVKVSLRSKTDVDVFAIARGLGGGGHRKAAGTVVERGLRESIVLIEDKVKEALGTAAAGRPA